MSFDTCITCGGNPFECDCEKKKWDALKIPAPNHSMSRKAQLMKMSKKQLIRLVLKLELDKA